MALLLLCALCGACGSPAESTESDTDNQPHQHATTAEPVKVMAATCFEAGYTEYLCDTCGETYREEVSSVGHAYGAVEIERATGLGKVTCSSCGAAVIPIKGADALRFDAKCKGDITLDFEVTGAPAEIEFIMGDSTTVTKTYEVGRHSDTFVKGLDEGWYTVSVKQNNADSAVNTISIQVDGTVLRKDALILELNKKNDTKGMYEDFFVYVKTSDPSGKYYTRYNFIYEYNTEIKNKADSTDNIDAFRVKEANLVEITGVTDTEVSYTKIANVLQSGEVSLAVKESGAADYVGGFHGDDHMTAFKLMADGVEYTPGEADIAVVCSTVEIFQEDIINRCSQPDVPVMLHTQNYTIDATGVKDDKSVEWLVSDFHIREAFLQMFTLYRTSNGKTVCETVSTYNGNGKLLGSETVDLSVNVTSRYDILRSNHIREVKYTSATSGVSAVVGFDIVDDSVALKHGYISVRPQKDNKWYAKFQSPTNESTPVKGEVWKLNTYFDIDYVAPAN